ncbi:MAG: hypothetical protein KJ011_20420, partial [Burkholderiaceae bacterium]|nr:hypothetical protein [Burkholderiaceae bacterium]
GRGSPDCAPRARSAGGGLTRGGAARHESRLRRALERYTDVPVLGAIGDDRRLTIVERHLGLVPSNEAGEAAQVVAALAQAVEDGVDLDALLRVAQAPAPVQVPAVMQTAAVVQAPAAVQGPALAQATTPVAPADGAAAALRIGIAHDEAFAFYYPDDLEALERAGAQLVRIDTLRDTALPELHGLFIGGGFPEALAARLAANAGLRHALRARIEAGLPVYAECGGLMYLARSITWHGTRHEMVGALPADVVMHDRAVGRGYMTLEETSAFPWPGPSLATVQAHEFHHSRLVDASPELRYAYRVLRGHGIDGRHDGIVHRNVLASYAHLRSVGGNQWPVRFVGFVRDVAGKHAAATEPRGRTAGLPRAASARRTTTTEPA